MTGATVMGPPPDRVPNGCSEGGVSILNPPKTSKDSSKAGESSNSSPVETVIVSEGDSRPDAAATERTKCPSVPYVVPEWSGPPCHAYTLEVLKDGAIIDQLLVSEKGAYMFGRVDLCDFILEHPTISRFHAVLQYKRSGNAYIYDTGSTHGTFINKKQVDKRIHVELHVGDIIRFGQSSRLYIFQGPPDLMPPETDRKLMKEAKMQQEFLDREASLLRARRESSLADGVSWGMGDDAIEELEDDTEEITWQTYKGNLTEKQQKTREKVMKRLEKIAHMKKEIDAIRAKDITQGGLTQGQQTQIARNELRTAQILEELESLEETLNDSIRESLGARGKRVNKKSDNPLEDDDYLSDDNDDFYDRTKKPIKPKPSDSLVETVESLIDKRDAMMKEIEDKRRRFEIDKESENVEKSTPEIKDSLDDFMSQVSSQLVLDKTARFEEELSSLQTELDKILHLLKLADPSRDPLKPKEPAVVVSERPEVKESVAEKPVYTVEKPQWLGQKTEPKPEPEDEKAKEEPEGEEAEKFVDYKDREMLNGGVLEEIEKAAPGLIIRQRKEDAEKECSRSDSMMEDAVALLLKHKRGYHDSDEEDEEERETKTRKTVGPQGDYETWLPPEGQSGDGRTKLNDRFGY